MLYKRVTPDEWHEHLVSKRCLLSPAAITRLYWYYEEDCPSLERMDGGFIKDHWREYTAQQLWDKFGKMYRPELFAIFPIGEGPVIEALLYSTKSDGRLMFVIPQYDGQITYLAERFDDDE